MFERLSQDLEERNKREAEISMVDLTTMLSVSRQTMLAIMRGKGSPMTTDEIAAALEESGQIPSLSREELHQALDDLVENRWLIPLGEGDRISYRPNLGRKRGSEFSIWMYLMDKTRS